MLNIFRIKAALPVAVVMLIGLGAANVWGAEWQPFDEAAFQEARESGQTVYVDFHATWCPTCAKQKPILEKLLGESEFEEVVAFVADYDKSTDLEREMRITSQSTIVVFQGDEEVARSTGVTDEGQLRELLREGL